MKVSSGTPVYRNIALDIANKIVRGEITLNEKISGRSTLAGMYKVSPETIRRAIALLHGMEVVSSNVGSGIEVLSVSAAEKFIERYKNNEYMSTVRENIQDILNQKKNLDKELEDNLYKITDYIERFNNISPFVLIEISITESCIFLGKRVKEIHFWQYTKATMVAYRRGEDIVVSPGPDYEFTINDIIVVIGSSEVYDKVCDFLYNNLN